MKFDKSPGECYGSVDIESRAKFSKRSNVDGKEIKCDFIGKNTVECSCVYDKCNQEISFLLVSLLFYFISFWSQNGLNLLRRSLHQENHILQCMLSIIEREMLENVKCFESDFSPAPGRFLTVALSPHYSNSFEMSMEYGIGCFLSVAFGESTKQPCGNIQIRLGVTDFKSKKTGNCHPTEGGFLCFCGEDGCNNPNGEIMRKGIESLGRNRVTKCVVDQLIECK